MYGVIDIAMLTNVNNFLRNLKLMEKMVEIFEEFISLPNFYILISELSSIRSIFKIRMRKDCFLSSYLVRLLFFL